MTPPCWVMPSGDLLADLAPDPLVLGGGEGLQLYGTVLQHHGRGDDGVTGDLHPELHALDTGHEQPAEVHPALAGLGDLRRVPGSVGTRRGRKAEPLLRRLVLVGVAHRLLVGERGVLGRLFRSLVLLATSEHVTVLPGRHRPMRIHSRPWSRPPSHDRRWNRIPLGPRRAGKFRHLVEAHLLDLLDDQLGDPVESFEPHTLARVQIDHDHLDLSTVPGIHRPGGIHQRQSAARGQPRAGVHKGRVAVGQRDRHPGGQHGALPGASSAASVVTRSTPASPGCPYDGTGTSGSSQRSSTSTGFRT